MESVALRDARFTAIRTANGRIRELELELGRAGTVRQTQEHITSIAAALDLWWDTHGFGHISNRSFTQYGGLETELSCHLFGRTALTNSKTPVTDKATKADWYQDLRARGFMLKMLPDEHEPSVIDTSQNRDLLKSLLHETFPSARIIETKNHYAKDVSVLRSITVFIRKLEDFEPLLSANVQTF